MTNDKAREYFSAHHEGTLEPGLTASLERRLREDAGLQAEFAAFVETVGSLEALRAEAVPIPDFLGARIASRLDPALDVQPVSFWATLLQPFRAAPQMGWALGVAGVLLVAAVGLRGLRVEDARTANVLPGGGDAERWTESHGAVSVEVPGGKARTTVVTPEGGEAQVYAIAEGQRFDLTLENPNSTAHRFVVDSGDGTNDLVALPGTRPAGRHAGSGSLRDFAAALADAYRVPVVVRGLALDETVRWGFDGLDAQVAAERALSGKGHATLMPSNVLQLGG